MHTSQNIILNKKLKQFLVITDGEKWHYLAVKKNCIIQRVKSKCEGGFHCLNCFHSYSTKYKLKKHYNICKDHDYCYIEMPNQCNRILKYNYGEKSMKFPFVIYTDLETLLERLDTCYNNPKKSSTTKINKHTPSGYLLFTQCSFDAKKKKD